MADRDRSRTLARCSVCGQSSKRDSRFCGRCGARLPTLPEGVLRHSAERKMPKASKRVRRGRSIRPIAATAVTVASLFLLAPSQTSLVPGARANHEPSCTWFGDPNDPECDWDHDGRVNRSDNCDWVFNPAQENRDGDGEGDSCDADDDNDGVADTSDNCPTLANPGQANSDGDSHGDACDADDDNDGAADGDDNCPQVVNPAQENSDGDAQGDACDTDDDNDGDTDNSDNCPTTPNPGQENRDGDAQGDSCDADDDNDGVGDRDDGCPTVAASTADGCPTPPAGSTPSPAGSGNSDGGISADDHPQPVQAERARTLTITYSPRRRAFSGRLTSQYPSCTSGQKVAVFENRKGRDPRLGSATTDASGRYSLRQKAAAGRYYAAVAETSTSTDACLAAQSKPIAVG
jgi:hypothetical protein